ncbi:MAG: MTH895/ArsE family thioredoxin-like protein [Deltaproteobacteria bacterium]
MGTPSTPHGRLRVRGIAVGLVGLEAAFETVYKELGSAAGVNPRAAAGLHLAILERRNYIPESAREDYLDALERYWKDRLGLGGSATGDEGPLVIRILGKECVSCRKIEDIVRSVLDAKGIGADIEYVSDYDEIWRYGVLNPPALVVNEKVVCAGRVPSRAQVETFISAFLEGRDKA